MNLGVFMIRKLKFNDNNINMFKIKYSWGNLPKTSIFATHKSNTNNALVAFKWMEHHDSFNNTKYDQLLTISYKMNSQNKEVKGISKEWVEEDDKNVLPNKRSRVILRGKIIMAIFMKKIFLK